MGNVRNHLISLFVMLIVALMLFSCGTVLHPFVRIAPNYSIVDADKLQKCAEYIEEQIWMGNREPDLNVVEGINLDTPTIRQAIKTRSARVELVKSLFDKGYIYEQNNGLVAIQRNRNYKRSTNRRERDKNALVVMGENNDRWALYEGIVEANNYPSRALSTVQDIFYRAQVNVLQQGHKYQNDQGEIMQK